MDQSIDELSFGVDLYEAAILNLDFLKYLYAQSYLQHERIIQRAIHRYRHFWLPLAAKYSHDVLSAPLDVELIWICHMLYPQVYLKDCVELVGTPIDHTLRSFKQRQYALKRTRDLWRSTYLNEPFKVNIEENQDIPDLHVHDDEAGLEKANSLFSCDLLGTAKNMIKFYYQVSLPHYRDSLFLETAIDKYERFLLLKHVHPDLRRAPSLDIYLIWRTHMMFPVAYEQYTAKMFGASLEHEYLLNEPEIDISLEVREQWKSVYKEIIISNGVQYRGNSGNELIEKLSTDDIDAFLPKQSLVRLSYVKLHGLSNSRGRLKIKFTTLDKSNNRLILTTLTGKSTSWVDLKYKTFWIDTMEDRVLNIEIYHVTGCGCLCFGSKSEIGHHTIRDFGSRYILPNANKREELIRLEGVLSSSADVKYEIKAFISPPNKRRCVLYLLRGEVSPSQKIPDEFARLLESLDLQRDGNEKSEPPTGVTVRHKLNNHFGETVFQCSVFQCNDMMTSAFQIYFDGKVVAVGHLINSEQLPLPTQVGDRHHKYITLKHHEGERAILIKNCNGDWGIMFGRWRSSDQIQKVGTSKTYSNSTLHQGCLQYKFHKLGHSDPPKTEFGYLTETIFNLESVHVELQKGLIIVDAESNEVAENIAIAISMLMLRNLCGKDQQLSLIELENEEDCS